MVRSLGIGSKSVAAVLVVALVSLMVGALPAIAQDYQVPDYQTPSEGGEAPDQGEGETPDTPDDAGEAPDTGAGAPEDTIRPQRGAALPHTGFEDGLLLAVAGAVLLLAGASLRRALRSPV